MYTRTSLPSRGLYLLTPDTDDTAGLIACVAPLLGAGVAVLQLRNKGREPGRRREQANALLPLCRGRGIPLLINDDWRLAAELGADGAHLGRDDGQLAQAREALGADAILGASCYGELERASRARDAGASYLAFGAMHASGTKPSAAPIGTSILAPARSLGLPVVAIGGITPDNAPAVIAAGADFVAVLGAAFSADDPVATIRAFARLFTPDIE